MKNITKYEWKKTIDYDNGVTLTLPTKKKVLVDLGLKSVGSLLCFGIGYIMGECLDSIPGVNEAIPSAIDYISGINVYDNLSGLFGLSGAAYGFRHSGVKTFENDYNNLEQITLSPIGVNLKE